MDYKTRKFLNGMILEIIKMLNHPSNKNQGQNTFYLFVSEGFNHFISIPFFRLKVYLIFAKPKTEKRFSLQTDLQSGFLKSFW